MVEVSIPICTRVLYLNISYANIFMGRLETQILAEAKKKPLVWWRYIDDVFTMWTHGENHLKEFLQHLNQAHPTIKFTAEWSPDSVSFLHVTVTLKEGRIKTDLYSKPTDVHQYLAVTHGTANKLSHMAKH